MKRFWLGLALISILAVVGCGVAPDKATRALTAQGLTDINIGGYSWFGCSRDDEFASAFTAKGADGQAVSGVVCGGWFKGVTVRYD